MDNPKTNPPPLPSYEKIRKDLRDMLNRKKYLDRNLMQLEDQIAKFEASYLEDTPNGNIIKGFDNYVKGTTARRKNMVNDSDRVFSNSSVTSLKMREQEEQAGNSAGTSTGMTGIGGTNTSSFTTATSSISSHIEQTPASSGRDAKMTSQRRKSIKRRKADDGSESLSEVETPGPNKRVRISFSRGPA